MGRIDCILLYISNVLFILILFNHRSSNKCNIVQFCLYPSIPGQHIKCDSKRHIRSIMSTDKAVLGSPLAHLQNFIVRRFKSIFI
jgi:hypothetical protein